MTINHVLVRCCVVVFGRGRETSKQLFVYRRHSLSMAISFPRLPSLRISGREHGIFTIPFFNWLSIRQIRKGCSNRTERSLMYLRHGISNSDNGKFQNNAFPVKIDSSYRQRRTEARKLTELCGELDMLGDRCTVTNAMIRTCHVVEMLETTLTVTMHTRKNGRIV